VNATITAQRYRRLRPLGHGGMASVYLAEDTHLGRLVALKLLAENLAGDEEFRARFLREARLAAGLSHPNVVRVYDFGEEGGRPYIVMEYVEGETLADSLRARGSLEPAEAAELGVGACAGLAAAHEAGLVHRDVKPQNLLVGTDGKVRIADFGIARSLDGTVLTQQGTVLGTAAYLAPEQAAGEPATAASDLYALGAVLYQLLTGRTPYDAPTLPELVRKQREEPVPDVRVLAPDVSPPLAAAVMRALDRDPRGRPQSAAAFARELAAEPAEAATEALPHRRPAPPRPPRSFRIRPRLVVLVVAVAAAVALAFVLSSGGQRPPHPQPSAVRPPSAQGTPSQQARTFARWLRAHAEP
jgi:eukaryotic-like serine/threonine-protein kinase